MKHECTLETSTDSDRELTELTRLEEDAADMSESAADVREEELRAGWSGAVQIKERVLYNWVLSCRFGQPYPVIVDPRRRRRRMWVHPLLRQRLTKGHFHRLYASLQTHPNKFYQYCRMSLATFNILLETVRPGITFQETRIRKCISAEERLLLTLRFLTTDLSYAALHYEFLIRKTTISGIVRSTCSEIWSRLHQVVMPEPKKEDWLRLSCGFEDTCQFPQCIGALDGKHIHVHKPPNSGSQFYNYKQYFSVVLLALVDSHYRFIIVDIGAYGFTGHSRVFNSSIVGQRLLNNQLDLPPPRQLPGTNIDPVPYVLVADEAFQLTRHVMRPYPRRILDHRRRIFNLLLSRARRLVECAFGILCAKWRILQSAIQLSEANVNEVFKAWGYSMAR
ncbi:uncharacterized protein [Dendrobates tinctorius]|uniref:uncharacterized protein n=1 Tax=Dendrobates tinctorius TaxID=92724 RepID=UPI003CCA098B